MSFSYSRLENISKTKWPKTQDHPPRGRPIETLGLKERTMTFLHYASIRTVEDLCSLTEKELKQVYGFGGAVLREDIKQRLAHHNLSLTPSE